MIQESLTRLRGLASPPDKPLYNKGDWDVVQEILGIQLPNDYKTLIEVYGQGVFRGREEYSGLLITSFCGPIHAATQAEGTSAYLRTIDGLRYATYPDVPGLLGFGTYADEDTLAWFTKGDPESWSIVYHDVESGFHEIKEMGIINLMVSILEESSPLHPGVIKQGEMEGPHTFRPES